jgi:fused signal recognition particle receptor
MMDTLQIVVGVVLLLVVGLGVFLATRRRLPPGGVEPTKLPETEAPKALSPGVTPVSAEAAAVAEAPAAPTDGGFFKRLVSGLARTQSQLVERFDAVIRGRKVIDESLYEELESILLTADVGIKTTQKLLEAIRQRASRDQLQDPQVLRTILREEILALLKPCASPEEPTFPNKPHMILIVGVNGAGKTTTIGKLASKYTKAGLKVILGAGDTFRAAASEQLEIWSERAGVDIVKNKEGSDPSAVIFDTIQAGRARGMDVVIADTAGRLHTKTNLMDELKKVTRVAGKAMEGAPHDVWLVLDSTMGQNALSQARIFHEGCHLTGLVLTKLDGTAKGGVVLAICDELRLPVRYIGIGEKVDDLQPFDPEAFVAALF